MINMTDQEHLDKVAQLALEINPQLSLNDNTVEIEFDPVENENIPGWSGYRFNRAASLIDSGFSGISYGSLGMDRGIGYGVRLGCY